MSAAGSIGRGLAASLPVVAGYLPVAAAFGAAGAAAGLPIAATAALSAGVFAGASQFLVVGFLAVGSSMPLAVLLGVALNLRHAVYAPLLAAHLPERGVARVLFAAALTDEVFATALATARRAQAPLPGPFLVGLAAGAYVAWVGGTLVGAAVGAGLASSAPVLADALSFALVALFIGLLAATLEVRTAAPAAIAVVGGIAGTLASDATLGILVGSVAGALAAALRLPRGAVRGRRS